MEEGKQEAVRKSQKGENLRRTRGHYHIDEGKDQFMGYTDMIEEVKQKMRVTVRMSSVYIIKENIKKQQRLSKAIQHSLENSTRTLLNLDYKFVSPYGETTSQYYNGMPLEYSEDASSMKSSSSGSKMTERHFLQGEVAAIVDQYQKINEKKNKDATEDLELHVSQGYYSSLSEYLVKNKGSPKRPKRFWYMKCRRELPYRCHYLCVEKKLENYYQKNFNRKVEFELYFDGNSNYLYFQGIIKHQDDQNKIENYFRCEQQSKKYKSKNSDIELPWLDDDEFELKELIKESQPKINDIFGESNYVMKDMLEAPTRTILRYHYCCNNVGEQIKSTIDDYILSEMFGSEGSKISLTEESSQCNTISQSSEDPSLFEIVEPNSSNVCSPRKIYSLDLSRLGDILNMAHLQGNPAITGEIDKNFEYAFPALSKPLEKEFGIIVK